MKKRDSNMAACCLGHDASVSNGADSFSNLNFYLPGRVSDIAAARRKIGDALRKSA
jgi:hypothetical protein